MTLHGLGPLVFCLGRITTFGVLVSSIGCASLIGVLSGSSKISCDTDWDGQPSAPSNRRYVATLLCRSSDETDCLPPSDSSVVYSPLASQLSNGCNSRSLQLLRNVIIPSQTSLQLARMIRRDDSVTRPFRIPSAALSFLSVSFLASPPMLPPPPSPSASLVWLFNFQPLRNRE